MKKLLLPFALCSLVVSCTSAPDIEKEVDDILSQMTLDEKIAILHAQSKFSSAGVPRLGVPELWTDDGPNGVRPEVLWDEWKAAGWTNDACTAFPGLTCLAASWNRDIAREYGVNVGEEARYRRKNVLLGPGINIYRTPLCGRNFEYMGEDPYLAGEMCAPYIQGVQSNDIAVCVKHFALNDNEHERHNTNVNIDDRTIYEIYLPAFKSAVQKGGAWSIMGAYNLWNDQHMCHNARSLNEILKGEWGFDGAVISDWGGCHDTDQAVRNGLDIEFGTWTDGLSKKGSSGYDTYYLADPYKQKIQSGEFGEDELNDKCRRVLRLMMRTKMGGEKGYGRFTCPEHYAVARKIGDEGIVLLKNEGGILPIKGTPKKIVVLGENAIKPMAVGGASSSLKAEHEITMLDGIKARFKDSEIIYERAYLGTTNQGRYNYSLYDISDPRTPGQMLSDALKAVKDADYVIFIGGLNKTEHLDCEGQDRLSYALPYGQDAVIDTLASLRKDLIYVSVAGSSYSMPWLGKVNTVVQAWYMGSEAGNSLADILSGDVNPSGKLPFSWGAELVDYPIRTEEQYPGIKREDSEIWDIYYTEGIYVGYRWFDTKAETKPLFAFGHGLSYTTFEYGEAKVSSKNTRNGEVTVSVDVTNNGPVAGAEVVQLYISDTEASVDRPIKELKGFEKVWLEPGQTKTVRIALDKSSLSWFNAEKHEWTAEKGEFTALVGASSDDIRTSVKFNLI